MADDLASDLQSGGFAKVAKVANPESYRGAKNAADDALGNVNSRIQDFYKKTRQSLGIDKKVEPGMKPGTFAKYKKEHAGDK